MSKLKSRRDFILASASLASMSTLSLSPTTAFAQDANWPTKRIRIVVPFPAGSITDTMARLLSEGLTKTLGQTVIVENKAGANGSIGATEVARAAPDGYTLLATNSSSITVNPSLYKNSPYKASDFSPVTLVLDAPFILNVNPEWAKANSINSVKDLVEYARKNPSKLSYGSGGLGNLAHLAFEMLSNATNIKATHVPYKSASQAGAAVMSGEINASFDTLASIPQIRAGKLKALAVTPTERISQMPDIPTMAQEGFPAINVTFWLGLLAPAGTPPKVIEKIYENCKQAMATPAAIKAIGSQGTIAMIDPKNFAMRISKETNNLAEIIKREKISVD